MVGNNFFLTACTDLVVIHNGTLTAEKYIQDILEQHVVPIAPNIDENLLPIQDKDRAHVAQVVRN